jgi:hypothetical protein
VPWRARQQRLRRVGAQRVHRLLGRIRVAGDGRRVEGGNGDQGQDRPGGGIDGDDRPGIRAQLGGREVLEATVDGQRQVARLRRARQDVVEEIAERVRIRATDQQILVRTLQAGAPEAEGRVADDVREGGIRVAADRQVTDQRRRGEHLAGGVEDGAAQQAATRGDDLGVVAAGRQRGRLDDLPPHHAARHQGERQDQVEAQPADVGGDHSPRSASVPICVRWLIDSSSPIIRKLASTLDPP